MTKKKAHKVVSLKEKRPQFKGPTVQQILDGGEPLLKFRLGTSGRSLFFRTILRHDLLVAAYECYIKDSGDWECVLDNTTFHCESDVLSQIELPSPTYRSSDGEEDMGEIFIGAADGDYGDGEERYSTDFQQYGSWQEAKAIEAKVISLLAQFVAEMKAYASDKKNHRKIHRNMASLRCSRDKKCVPENCLHEYSL